MSNKTVRISDTVICINNDGYEHILTEGESYIVTDIEWCHIYEDFVLFVDTGYGVKDIPFEHFKPFKYNEHIPEWATHFLIHAFNKVVFVNPVTREYANKSNPNIICVYSSRIDPPLYKLKDKI